MRVLFDNNVAAPLRCHLVGHQVDTAKEMGWQELKNGDLLTAAEQAGFQVMVTGDKNLAYQQNLEGRTLALVVLQTIDWSVLKRAPATLVDIAAAVDRANPGSFEAMPEAVPHDPRPAVRLVDHPAQSSSPPSNCMPEWFNASGGDTGNDDGFSCDSGPTAEIDLTGRP